MTSIFTSFASAESGDKDFLSALGIDWMTLIVQIVAFLLLLWFLAKFVYPHLTKMLDERDKKFADAEHAADEARKKAESAEADIDAALKKARAEASEIVTTAKQEAALAVEAAEKKAKHRADSIVQSAKDELEKDVIAARATLKNETLGLIASATKTVIGQTITPTLDKKVISESLDKAKK